MKILLISNDKDLINLLIVSKHNIKKQVSIIQTDPEPVEILSSVLSIKPSVLMLDDDFLQPHSVHILRSIRKFQRDIPVIFITSDTSIDLGREISQLSIQFYAIKPLNKTDLNDAIHSINQLLMKKKSLIL